MKQEEVLINVCRAKVQLENQLIEYVNKCLDEIIKNNPDGMIIEFCLKHSNESFVLGQHEGQGFVEMAVGLDMRSRRIIVETDEYLNDDDDEDEQEQDSMYVPVDVDGLDLFGLINLSNVLHYEKYRISKEKSYAELFYN